VVISADGWPLSVPILVGGVYAATGIGLALLGRLVLCSSWSHIGMVGFNPKKRFGAFPFRLERIGVFSSSCG